MSARTPSRLVLDLDVGIDDALAVAFAVASPEVDLSAVTCTFGNVSARRSAANALAVLDLLGRPDVPVYLGEEGPLAGGAFAVSEGSCRVHGPDGLGGAPVPPSTRSVRPEGAVDFLLKEARHHGPDLAIVATGSLTNLATAWREDPGALESVGSVTVMGGALTVPGNVTPWCEANVFQDPEAADVVLSSRMPLTMVGLDVTHRVVLTRRDAERWRALCTEAGAHFFTMASWYLDVYEAQSPYLGGSGLHDPLAVAVALDPSLVEVLSLAMEVELEGPTRGRTIGDPRRLHDPGRVCRVAVGVDGERFKGVFLERLTAAFRGLDLPE